MARCGSGYLNRRVADRGNDGGASDLFNHEVEQPQRLAWLTPGLGAVEWVGRLQHLVPGLGLVSSSSRKETEPVKTVRDELIGNEEHPSNGDIIYDYPPVYDEYEDEEWYSWMTGAEVTYDPTGYVTDSLLSLNGRRILVVDSSPPCTLKIQNIIVIEAGHNVDIYIENIEFFLQKAIIGLIAGNCMDGAITKVDGQVRGFNYVFDPGGWFLKLLKLEDEFFRRGGE